MEFPSFHMNKGASAGRVRGEVTQRSLTRQDLMRVKTRALRGRVWFMVTSRLERGIVDLTIRCVERIRSLVLARTVSEIIVKILATLENSFLGRAEKIGAEIVERISGIAVEWGNSTAFRWKHDPSFVRFLGVNAINSKGRRI